MALHVCYVIKTEFHEMPKVKYFRSSDDARERTEGRDITG